MDYTKNRLSGLGKKDRERLSELIRQTKGTITVSAASSILNTPPSNTAKILSKLAQKGWLYRIKVGIYIPVPLESKTGEISLIDPWVVAERLFSKCYIGGWSAAEYWGLTEQIFKTIIIMTTKKLRNRSLIVNETAYMLRTIPDKALFGLINVWREQGKVSISDPSRTMVDLLNHPMLGGGIRSTGDIFQNYLKSDQKDIDMLIKYAKSIDNGAVFKRLGFLLERFTPDEKAAINICKSNLTKGYSRLDPTIKSGKLITRWKLWVPLSWVKEYQID